MPALTSIARSATRLATGPSMHEINHPRLATTAAVAGGVTALAGNVIAGGDVTSLIPMGAAATAAAGGAAAVLRSNMGAGPRLAALTAALTGAGFGGTLGMGSGALQNSNRQRELVEQRRLAQ